MGTGPESNMNIRWSKMHQNATVTTVVLILSYFVLYIESLVSQKLVTSNYSYGPKWQLYFSTNSHPRAHVHHPIVEENQLFHCRGYFNA